MPFTAGARIGPYEIRSLIGSGGMGEVYLARDANLDRDVALKLLPTDVARDPERLRRFEQEARSASALNHPAIVAIYELGQDGPQPYISMELVDGQTLRNLLAAGPMPLRRALQVAAQVADGLSKAHEAGIAHRDLKPENVMVSRDGFAKILDFGLAKLTARDADSLQTMTERGTRPGSVLGTVGYMSPEQASGATADTRADQFSFGLILYEMLTGLRAFSRPTSVETLSAIIRDDPTPIGQINPSIPVAIRWIVERCLAKAPEDRYGSTRDLARDLAAARDGLSELSSSPASAPAPRRAAVRARELLAWSLAVVFALATIGVVLRQRQSPPADTRRPTRFTIAPPDKVNFVSTVGASPFTLSPDGSRLAFLGVGADGRRMIWLRAFDSLDARALQGTEGGLNPFWSPDGAALGFFAGSRLKRITLATGNIDTICETMKGGRPPSGGGTGTWNREGVIVFAAGLDTGLFRVAASGGTPAPVTTVDAAHEEGGHLSPLFLPDGARFLYRVLGRDTMGVYAASLGSPARKRLISDAAPFAFTAPDRLLFLRDRALFAQRLDLERLELSGEPTRIADNVATAGPSAAFDASASGALIVWSGGRIVTQPTWLRRDGAADGTVGPPGSYVNVAVSPDGRQVAADMFDGEPAIWLLDVARGTASRATFGGGAYESSPVWAPDGRAFVFASARAVSPPNLFVKRIGAPGDDEHLVRSRLQSFPQSWSPDGRVIAYTMVDPETAGDIWIVEAAGNREPVAIVRTRFSESHARISPDGRWLAYQSNESGGMGVYVTPFPNAGDKWQVSIAGGAFPVWRRDSRELYYRAADGFIMAVPIRAGDTFEPGKPVALFKPDAAIGTVGVGTFYDAAPDGRFLVNRFVERTSPPATVVLNWPAGTQPTP